MPPETARFALSLPPTLAAIGQAQAALRQFLAGEAPAFVFRAELVLEEMLANVVRHAGLPEDAFMVLMAARSQAGVRLTVEDLGPPFDPTQVALRAPARSLENAVPGGLGLNLIRGNAARMEYARTAEGWNRFTVLVADAGEAKPG